ncbi:hypothetical protein, partial [Geobacillus thermoleovorans]|uniref:hypothetical protein n=1 Tax=Geobacillus thermoleovorans TaxID=33941 RepID=UPI003D1FAF5A
RKLIGFVSFGTDTKRVKQPQPFYCASFRSVFKERAILSLFEEFASSKATLIIYHLFLFLSTHFLLFSPHRNGFINIAPLF